MVTRHASHVRQANIERAQQKPKGCPQPSAAIHQGVRWSLGACIQVGKKGCRSIFNMCGEIWWWASRRVAPENVGPFCTFRRVSAPRVAPENVGPFTLFLVKSRRVAPGNFGAYVRPLSSFPTWACIYQRRCSACHASGTPPLLVVPSAARRTACICAGRRPPA